MTVELIFTTGIEAQEPSSWKWQGEGREAGSVGDRDAGPAATTQLPASPLADSVDADFLAEVLGNLMGGSEHSHLVLHRLELYQ